MIADYPEVSLDTNHKLMQKEKKKIYLHDLKVNIPFTILKSAKKSDCFDIHILTLI